MIGRRELVGDLWANVKFRLEGSTDQGSEEIRDRILEAISGVPVKDLERLAAPVLAGVLPRLYPEMLRTAYEHQDARRPVFIVTAASHEMAEMLAHVLAFDGGIGTRSEIEDGIYTGRPDGPFTYRSGKAEEISRVAAERGIDLSESYAYSDSESDLPMLELVGNPVAVNPDSALLAIARERGWRVMHFDKLGRRLKIAAALAAVGLVGGGGGYVAARLRPRSGLRFPGR